MKTKTWVKNQSFMSWDKKAFNKWHDFLKFNFLLKLEISLIMIFDSNFEMIFRSITETYR